MDTKNFKKLQSDLNIIDPKKLEEAKYKAEQLAVAEERKRQEEAELAERQERERLEKEQRLETNVFISINIKFKLETICHII